MSLASTVAENEEEELPFDEVRLHEEGWKERYYQVFLVSNKCYKVTFYTEQVRNKRR